MPSPAGPSTSTDGSTNVVCIAGMHRSGTSMVARLLNVCGLELGPHEKILQPNPDNPAGYWENSDFMRLNERMLLQLGGGWDLPPLIDNIDWENNPAILSLRLEAQELTDSFAGRTAWGWKDPRNTLLLPFWKSLIPDLRIIACIRNPIEVAFSLHKRAQSSIPFSLNLWGIYNERLLSDTTPEERIDPLCKLLCGSSEGVAAHIQLVGVFNFG